jgi:alpha-ribazole phosphatase
MKVVLVRHPAPLIAPGVCYGRRLDIAAVPAGNLVSDPALAGAQLVWSSPARRCLEVAASISVSQMVPLRVDDRLQELDFGDWEGRPWSAIPRDDLDRWAADPLAFAPPRGESGASLIARVRSFRAGLREDCVVVSHGGPLKVLGALLRGQAVDLLAAPPAIGSVSLICPEA